MRTRWRPKHIGRRVQSGSSSGTTPTPANAMKWPDGSVMKWPDGSVMKWPS